MKLRPFELALAIGFGVLGVGAVILLAIATPDPQDTTSPEYIGPVQVWGTVQSGPMTSYLRDLGAQDENFSQVTYRYIPEDQFNDTMTEALADGAGPDLILASHEHLIEQRKRIQPIPYESFPLRDFQDLYTEGAEVFALTDGIYGYPVTVDPLMLYWNKDILTNAGFLTAPRTWEELVNVQLPDMVRRSDDRSITRAVLAFGVYNNSKNAFASLSTLLLQSGSSFVSEESFGESVRYRVQLDQSAVGATFPFTNAASFFLRFSQPANSLYSWNRSYQSDLTEFISGDLVFYLGYGSEGVEIENLNPNLNFDIAEVPQSAVSDVRRTYGKVFAVSPLRSSDNLSGAYQIMQTLTSLDAISRLSAGYNMAPSTRALLSQGSNDQYGRLYYRSAPVSYGWLHPDREVVDDIFNDMTTAVSENRNNINEAITTAEQKLSQAYD